jgi:hypothetical protein
MSEVEANEGTWSGLKKRSLELLLQLLQVVEYGYQLFYLEVILKNLKKKQKLNKLVVNLLLL